MKHSGNVVGISPEYRGNDENQKSGIKQCRFIMINADCRFWVIFVHRDYGQKRIFLSCIVEISKNRDSCIADADSGEKSQRMIRSVSVTHNELLPKQKWDSTINSIVDIDIWKTHIANNVKLLKCMVLCNINAWIGSRYSQIVCASRWLMLIISNIT